VGPDGGYNAEYFAGPASEFANFVKEFPREWILDDYQGITEEALAEVRGALEQSSRETLAAGQEQRAQLNELMENDKKAKAVFEQFRADDVAKLEQELAALKAQKTEDSPADGLRSQIQQLTIDLEYGNLNEAEYAQMRECRE